VYAIDYLVSSIPAEDQSSGSGFADRYPVALDGYGPTVP